MNITLDPSTVTTNDNFPNEHRAISPAFLFGIVNTNGSEPRPVMPMLCAAVIGWGEDEVELERETDDDDDTPADADADENLRTNLDKVTRRVDDEDEQDDDGADDDEDDEGDGERANEDTDDDAPVNLFDNTYMQPQLTLTIKLTAAVIADYKKYLETATEDAELVVQIAYGPNPKTPVFWHTYDIDASDLELVHSNSESATNNGELVAYMTLPVLGCTKFNTAQ